MATNPCNSTTEIELHRLAASRARVVATADETRRRIERNLHDGLQQRLVSLALELKSFRATEPTRQMLLAEVSRIEDELEAALDELREISRGIHPAILSDGGLAPALRMLARRSAIPVELEPPPDERLPKPVEMAAYHVVSEALTNVARHARASVVWIAVELRNGALLVTVRDDGVGGADPGRGTGLIGLQDRVEAMGGTIDVESPPAAGTSLLVALPVQETTRTGTPSLANA